MNPIINWVVKTDKFGFKNINAFCLINKYINMRKFLLLISVLLTATPLVKAQDPVFPESFEVTFDAQGPTVTSQGFNENDGVYEIFVSGTCNQNDVTVTLATPAGWDGMYSLNITDFFSEMPHAAPAVDMCPMEDLLNQFPAEQSNTVAFKADGTEKEGWYFLFKGEEYCASPFVVLYFNVESEGGGGDNVVEFPESLEVTLSVEGLEVNQETEADVHEIFVSGETEADEVTVTLGVPEGWDGYVGMMNDNFGGGGVVYSSTHEPEWFPLEEAYGEGFEKTNSLTFKVNGAYQSGNFFLYKGDQVDTAMMIVVEFTVTKKGGETPDVEFPESFEVTLSDGGIGVESDYVDNFGEYNISITGESKEKEVTVTVTVPEDWDGFVGKISDEVVEPMMNRAPAFWVSIDTLLDNGYTKCNSFTFPTDGETHSAELNLYKGDMVEVGNVVYIEFNVKYEDGVSTIDAENGSVRFFDLYGAEVKNPAPGVYVKVAGGKTTKVVVK